MAQQQEQTETHPRRKTLLKWSGITAAAVLTLLIILGIGLAGLLGSESGRLWLLNEGLSLGGLDTGPLQVKVDGARTPSLSEWEAERILVTRDEEPWLDFRNFHLAWVPSELLQRRILVRDLSASRLDVYTDAGTGTEEEPKPQDEGGGAPPSVAVESFRLDRLNIIGTAQDIPSYTFTGSVRLFWESLPLELDLQAQSLPEAGQAPMSLVVTSTAESSDRLRLDGALEEAPGGVLSQLMQLPEGSGIDLDFALTAENTGSGYAVSINHLRMPFLERQISAEGGLALSEDLQTINLAPLLLSTGEHTHRIEGTASAQALDLQLHINQFPLVLISPWVEQIEGGDLSATLAITGAPADPRIAGQLSGASTYQDHSVTLRSKGQFSKKQLVFDQLQANFGEATLDAHGRLDLTGADSNLQFSLSQLPASYATLFGASLPEGLTARLVEAQGRLRGDFRKPSGTLEALAKGQYRDQGFTARLDAEGNLGRVAVEAARLELGDASLRAEGVLDIQGEQSDLRVTLVNLPASLAELANVELPPSLSATLNGSAQVQGALKAPQVSGELRADGAYREQPFKVRVAGSGSTEQLRLREARATVGEASLSAEGSVDIAAKQLDMALALDEAPLELLELAQMELPDGLSGQASGSAKVEGPFSAPEVVSQIAARGTYQELPFELVANGGLVDRHIDIQQVRLNIDGTTALSVEGFLHPDQYDLRLTANDLPTRTLSALGWGLVTGEFNGNLRVQGTPDEPNIDGDFTYEGRLTGLDLATGEKTTFELGWYTELTTQNQSLSLESVFTRNDQRTGTFQLSVPITRYLNHFKNADASDNLPIAFDANGAVDLAVLSLVLDPDIHRISGRAAVRMDGSGTVAQPDLTGVFELLNVSYENTLTGTLLTDMQLLLKSQGTRITIAEAVAQSRGDGQLRATGTINWRNPDSRDAVDVKLIAESANLLNREDLDGEVSGELALVGSFEELWLRGELEVSPLAANIEAAFQSQIPEIEVIEVYGDPEEPVEAEPVAASVAPTIHLDLTIEAEQQAFLRGRGLDAELAGEIHLGGTLAEPNYEGEFNVLRGVFEVFGRKFELEEGEVLFANNAIYLRIPGEYEHKDYTIRAELSGTADDLSLNLSSVPTLPEDEILSLLIFGQSVQNITPFQAVQLAAAVRSLQGGGGGFDPVNFTRDALGVDTLSIESASTESGTGVSVGVGKYISDKVYLELERTPSEVQPWQGSVEIQLTPRLHLRSTIGGEGRTRADLLWKRDF